MSQITLGKQHAVLFDLDGTLVDTAPDLATALNATLAHAQLAPLPYDVIRPAVSNGANGLITLAFGDNVSEHDRQTYKTFLIDYYQQHIADKSVLFEGMSELLQHLEACQIPWGVVTNKPAYLTQPLLEQMNLSSRAACVVCGDQVKAAKPHPESIYLACKQINVQPSKAAYLGDAERDIRAGRLAGLTTIACGYGYVAKDDSMDAWNADISIHHSTDLLKLFQ